MRLKIPEEYKKFDKKIYYVSYNYSTPDKDDWYSLIGCTIYKTLEKAEKNCKNEPKFKDKKISGTLKELAEFLRGKLLKKEIKLSRFRNKEKELFYAYYNHFEAKALNRAHIKKIRERNSNKREYEISIKKLAFIKKEREELIEKNRTNTQKFRNLESEILLTENEIKKLKKLLKNNE